jgi:hypothetical protein
VTTSMTRGSPRSGRAWRASKACGIREAKHLTERQQILDRLVAALRPGGWMVIEDYDWTGLGFEDADPRFARAAEAVITFMQQAGFEPHYGRQVVADMAAAGLTDVHGEGRALIIDSHSPGFDFFRLSFESLRDAVVGAGLLSREDADWAAARFAEAAGIRNRADRFR